MVNHEQIGMESGPVVRVWSERLILNRQINTAVQVPETRTFSKVLYSINFLR